jgi:DNA-binding response OmpR family regulator
MAIPVIMMTAVETDEAKLKAVQMYCEDYINKPVTADVLEQAIEGVLQRNQGRG